MITIIPKLLNHKEANEQRKIWKISQSFQYLLIHKKEDIVPVTIMDMNLLLYIIITIPKGKLGHLLVVSTFDKTVTSTMIKIWA